MTTYEVVLPQSDEVIGTEAGLFDIPELRDTVNPFANYAVALFDDVDGDLFEKFERGTRVDIQWAEGLPSTLSVNDGDTESINDGEIESHTTVNVGGTLNLGGTLEVVSRERTTRIQGFVVERREIEDNGADQLEVEIYSLDQLLRGDKVTQSTEGVRVFDALEQIIVNDTPVTWNPNLVDVEDNFTLTRDLRGERVEEALLFLSFTSGNERIAVNANREFVFTRQETEPAPRDIGATEWFYADVPEEGKEVINEVRVWYDDGEERVTVDNGAEKLALQDALELDDPYSTVKEVKRPKITLFEDAKEVANQILNDREAATPIVVTTFGLETAEPGQVISVEIPSKGVSGDFEIASLTYDWGSDETTLILVEITEYQDDLLVRITDAVERVELEGINRDADDNRVTDTRVEALIDVEGTLNGVSYDRSRFTNTGRNILRDGWNGGDPIDITHIAIGNDPTGLSRTNNELANETNRVNVSETLDGTKAVDYDGSFGDTSAQEVGLFDSDNNLICRLVWDESQGGDLGTLSVNDGETYAINDGETETYSTVNVGGTLNLGGTLEVTAMDLTASVTLTVQNNPENERGVFTDVGQETIRDMLADNDPNQPEQYAYGADGTTPDESDTALGNQVFSGPLGDNELADVSTDQEWEDFIGGEFADTDPFVIENGEFGLAQIGFFFEAEDNASGGQSVSRSDFSGGEGWELEDIASSLSASFDTAYTIPGDEIAVGIRHEDIDGDDMEFEIRIDGDVLDSGPVSFLEGVRWFNTSETVSDLEPGGHTVEVNITTGTGEWHIDCFALVDDRFEYTFDNEVHEPDGYLDGPRLYPELSDISVTRAADRRTVAGLVNSTWNDTTEGQFIEAANDGETFIREDNTDTWDNEFSTIGDELTLRLGLASYPSDANPQNATPRFNYNGQAIDTLTLTAIERAIYPFGLGITEVEGVVPQGSIVSERLREAGQLSANDDLLTRSIFAEFDVLEGMEIRSSEKTSFDNA